MWVWTLQLIHFKLTVNHLKILLLNHNIALIRGRFRTLTILAPVRLVQYLVRSQHRSVLVLLHRQ